MTKNLVLRVQPVSESPKGLATPHDLPQLYLWGTHWTFGRLHAHIVYGKGYKIAMFVVQRSNEAEPVSIIFQIDQNWYILFFAFLLSWLILLIIRKRHRSRREVKEQIYLSLSGLFALLLMEIFATSTNLWNYVPENWPIILWPTYFVAILFGYQLLRSIEGLFS